MGPDPPPSLPSLPLHPSPISFSALHPLVIPHLLFGRTGLPHLKRLDGVPVSLVVVPPTELFHRPLAYVLCHTSRYLLRPCAPLWRSPLEAPRHTSPRTNAKLKRTTPYSLCKYGPGTTATVVERGEHTFSTSSPTPLTSVVFHRLRSWCVPSPRFAKRERESR